MIAIARKDRMYRSVFSLTTLLAMACLSGCAPAPNPAQGRDSGKPATTTPTNPQSTAQSPASSPSTPTNPTPASSATMPSTSTIKDTSTLPNGNQLAVVGGGCFWGVEHIMRQQPGVIDAVSGYSGGRTDNPTYKDVCYANTGHVEVVEVTFDPKKISYAQVLNLFFRLHDPTQVNGQGPDHGEQYRSVIFFRSDAQKKIAEDMIADLTAKKAFRAPIATAVEPLAKFWRAEEYHQKYYTIKGSEPYCHFLRPDFDETPAGKK